METKAGFTKMTIEEFESYISNLRIGRTVLTIQQHHTYSPSYIHFKGKNHFELQKGMKQYHVTHNGWENIGQHFTTFPDGTILTGRSIEKSPACIYGNNANSVCIENLGDFDKGADVMNSLQKDTIVRMTAALCKKFNLAVNTDKIVYHHWFNLSTGVRNNGTKNNKSCPGTNFFGGNSVSDCQSHFIPLVYSVLNTNTPNPFQSVIVKYVIVHAQRLNTRNGPGSNFSLVTEREPLQQGAVLRIFGEKEGWFKISSSAEHWVYGKLTNEVKHVVVNTDDLNVRSGPSINFLKAGSIYKGQEVFIIDEVNDWCRISMEDRWVKKSYLDFK